MLKKLKKLITLPIILSFTIQSGCQSNQKQTRDKNATLILSRDGIIEKVLTPPNIRLEEVKPINNTKPSKLQTLEKPESKDIPNPEGVENNIKMQKPRVINIGRVGTTKLEVYTSFPVPTRYAPAQVIGRNNQPILIPATPTKFQPVNITATSGINRISGFVDYGPTVNIPVQTPTGTRYIQQKSPMPVPIIDSFRVIYR